MIDDYLDKLEEWIESSHGKIRADVVHDKLRALGYEGSERTTRRVVAMAKKSYRAGRRRLYRPWVPEPGMWFGRLPFRPARCRHCRPRPRPCRPHRPLRRGRPRLHHLS
jgi:hypothetical protein